jgi:hypothetical protein
MSGYIFSGCSEYGVRWTEFGRNDRAVSKEKFFSSREARDKFADKVRTKDSFWRFDSWFN